MGKYENVTDAWKLYQEGRDYNIKINLYDNVNKNEAFYAGDQWRGVQSNGLSTPVFNIIKQALNWFIAAITSQKTKMQFVPDMVGDEAQDESEEEVKQAAVTISAYSDTLWEKQKMDTKIRQWLLDSAISGDACNYMFFDPSIDVGQKILGDIENESVDNVNVMFGNPNDKRVQPQPYIIIAFRDLVSKLKKEAKENGVSDSDINLITPDEDYEYQSGDRSKIEIDSQDDTNGKCIALIKLYKNPDTNTVWFSKSTKSVEIKKPNDTKLSLYPVAWMNWDVRKNSYHGQSPVTGLIPNQIFINKMFAMVMLSLQMSALPRIVYDKTRIAAISNQVGAAYGVQGNIQGVIDIIKGGDMSAQIMQVIDLAIKYTKDFLGVFDAAIGNVRPENTSAIIAVSQNAMVPLENVKASLYQFVEDIGLIWLDMMATYYGKRKISITKMGKREIVEFDFDKLKKMRFNLKIETGASSYWSEISQMQTLDNLLNQNRIDFIQYLERLPKGMIIKQQELIDEIKGKDTKLQFIYEQMAKFMEKMPPDIQQMLQTMKSEEMENMVMDMMMMQPEELNMHIEQMRGNKLGGAA